MRQIPCLSWSTEHLPCLKQLTQSEYSPSTGSCRHLPSRKNRYRLPASAQSRQVNSADYANIADQASGKHVAHTGSQCLSLLTLLDLPESYRTDHARSDEGLQIYEKTFSTTCPPTSVSRKSRPWNRYVSLRWFRPSKCSNVACRS